MNSTAFAIGVDLGGTNLRVGAYTAAKGLLEPHASATGVRRSAMDLIAHGAAPGLAALHARSPAFDARDVADLAKDGDADAKAIFDKLGRSLGIGLASLVNTLNLPLYIIGGGLANAWDLFSPALFQELQSRSYIYRLAAAKTLITTAQLGPDAGLLGACLLPISARAEHGV